MKSLFILLFFISSFAQAEMLSFGGIGLVGGQSAFTTAKPSATSKFSTLGYMGEGGIIMGSEWALQASGEVGMLSSNNTMSSNSYMESATTTYYGAKAGILHGNSSSSFGFGVGARLSDWTVKSLSTATNSYNEIKYKGTDSLVYGDINLNASRRYRTTLEAQYVTGTLKSEKTSISDIKYKELLFSIRFYVIFE